MRKRKISFKHKVLIPITAVFVISVLIISVLNYRRLDSTVRTKTKEDLDIFTKSLLMQSKQLDTILDVTKQTLDEKNIATANSVEYILENISVNMTAEELRKIAELLGVFEINIADRNAVVVNSTIEKNIGFDYASTEITKLYVSLAKGEISQLIEEPRISVIDNDTREVMRRYLGVARTGGGFIQLGVNAEIFGRLQEAIDIKVTVKNTKLGDNGYGLVVTDGTIKAHPENNIIGRDVSGESWYKTVSSGDGFAWIEIDDVKYYAGYKNDDGVTVMGLVPETDFYKELYSTLFVTVIFFIVSIIIMIAVVYIIVDRLVMPIKKLSESLGHIAKGDLSVSVSSEASDEVGQLSRDIAVVVEKFIMLTCDINALSWELITNGNTDYKIDNTNYNGDYRAVIDGINEMTEASSAELRDIIKAFTELSEGDFNAELRRFPGKKADANESFDLVKEHLKLIYFEIHLKVKEAADGKLAMKIDTSSYSGGWDSLRKELNNLLDAILRPIREASGVLLEIAAGNFEAAVEGDYNGEFAVIKDSVNAMAASMKAYTEESKRSFDTLKNIMNGLDAEFYVSDINTDEILFINENMLKNFNVEGDGVGRICWKTFHTEFDKRCDFCPCGLLEYDPTQSIVWESSSSVTNRYYRHTDRYIDWRGGEKVHLHHAVDITDIKKYMTDKLEAEQAMHESDLAKGRAEAAREAIISSLTYASKIQKNLLPKEEVFKEAFSDYSIIWKPRDIVGGDIYWIKTFDEGTVLCVCDCTGHGTPGALLTTLVVSMLEASVNKNNYKDTADILLTLDQKLADALNVDLNVGAKNEVSDIKDGCDIAVIYIAKDGGVTISSGNIHIFICDGKQVTQLKGQKIFIGEGKLKSRDEIKEIKIPYNPENKYYIASDGLYDQIGGEYGIPFGYGTFKRIILENHNETQAFISEKIWEEFEDYRDDQPRRDDFELITIKI